MSRPALRLLTVTSPDATQGVGVVTFRMPDEVDNANATELKVQLPADQPRRRRTTVDGSREPVPSSTGAQ